jgi:hypothetical protein
MKYILILLIGFIVSPRTIEQDLGKEQIEFLKEHDAYDDIMETFFNKEDYEHYRVKKKEHTERRVQ